MQVVNLFQYNRKASTHVQDWIDAASYPKSTEGEAYARFVLHFMGLPSRLRLEFNRFMKDKTLWCTAHGMRWKVIGTTCDGALHVASSDDVSAVTDYFYVDECKDWSATATNFQ